MVIYKIVISKSVHMSQTNLLISIANKLLIITHLLQSTQLWLNSALKIFFYKARCT